MPSCPCCHGEIADESDGIIVCLGCTAHLRRVGDWFEVTGAPPGAEAVPAAVEPETTDRATVGPSFTAAAEATTARRTDEAAPRPDEVAPLPPPPASAEDNAPRAPTAPEDDRTPIVPIVVARAPAPSPQPPSTAAAPAAPSRPAPSPVAAPSPRAPSPVAAQPPVAARPRLPLARILVFLAVALLAAAITLYATR